MVVHLSFHRKPLFLKMLLSLFVNIFFIFLSKRAWELRRKKGFVASLSKNMIHFEECLRTQNNLAPYEGLVRGSSKGKGNCLGKSNDKSISLVNNDKETSADEPTFTESTYDRVYNNRGTPCIRCGTKFNELCKIPHAECVSQSHIAYRERK